MSILAKEDTTMTRISCTSELTLDSRNVVEFLMRTVSTVMRGSATESRLLPVTVNCVPPLYYTRKLMFDGRSLATDSLGDT